MWKKDRNILFFTIGLLMLVLLFAWAAGKCRFAAWMNQNGGLGAGARFEDGGGLIAVSARAVKKNSAGGSETAMQSQPETGKKGKVALTFDDGPSGTYTPQLLDGLAKRNVKATFFITGENAQANPELVLRAHREGHLIGNHTYSHLQLNAKNREQFKQELILTNEIIEKITGEEVVYVRPPFGSWDKSFEEELNMFPVLWTIDPLDWCTDSASCVVNKVVSKVKENSIILLHDEYASTVTAALQIVDELQGQGYEFVTVEEILFD